MLGLQVVAYFIAAMLLSASAAILSSSLILTSSAGHALQDSCSKALQGSGHILSAYDLGTLCQTNKKMPVIEETTSGCLNNTLTSP